MTGIDIAIEVYKMVDTPTVRALLAGGRVWQHNRPVNSPYPDVVISLPVFEGNSRAVNYVDVNIHTPNLEGYYPIAGAGEDHTFPNLAKHKEIVDAVLPLIQSIPGVSLQPAIRGVPIRDSDGQWYSNIRVNLVTLDPGASLTATLEEIVSTPDGYGGVNVSYNSVWTGLAERLSIVEGSQLNETEGRLDLLRRGVWRIPSSGATPQKYHRLVTSDGVYTITGISPEGGAFWRLTTVRKDGPN